MTDTTTTPPIDTDGISFFDFDIPKDPEGNWDFDGDGIKGFDLEKMIQRPVPLWMAVALGFVIWRFL
jgi:hypothetical protein